MQGRNLLVASFAALLLIAVGPALAGATDALGFTEAETEESEVTDTTIEGPQPAVPAEPVADEEEEQPWTARFLAPTVLAIGVIALVLASAYYGVRIRGRYRVVD